MSDAVETTDAETKLEASEADECWAKEVVKSCILYLYIYNTINFDAVRYASHTIS